MVFIPFNSPVFQRYESGNITGALEAEVVIWLLRGIGKQVHTFADDVSEERPWRHRVWKVNTTHAFFFYTAKQAALFKLRWG